MIEKEKGQPDCDRQTAQYLMLWLLALGIASAPLSVNLMGIPDPALFLPSLHLTFVYAAQAAVLVAPVVIRASFVANHGLMVCLLRAIVVAVVGIRLAVVLEQVGNGTVGLL